MKVVDFKKCALCGRYYPEDQECCESVVYQICRYCGCYFPTSRNAGAENRCDRETCVNSRESSRGGVSYEHSGYDYEERIKTAITLRRMKIYEKSRFSRSAGSR